MDDISYDQKSDTITLQPGVHWNKTEPRPLADDRGAAFTCSLLSFLAPLLTHVATKRFLDNRRDVGTGLLLGGGLSFLSPAHGFACDSYKSLDVVLVDGTLVTATVDNQHSDLFRAFKGLFTPYTLERRMTRPGPVVLSRIPNRQPKTC